jgi:hypothetical protein
VANALAYYDTAAITAVKSFIVQTPGKQEIFSFLPNICRQHFWSIKFWFLSRVSEWPAYSEKFAQFFEKVAKAVSKTKIGQKDIH